jgi:ribonuclease-3
MTPEERAELEAVLGHHFQRPEELDRALTHRSHRQSSNGTDNERLEFLGDRVLGLIASEHLCRSFPDWDSGQLSKGLARVVSATSLHAAAKKLKLGHYLRLGPGEEKTGGRDKKRLLADAYEAVLAAIYLDAGLAAAASFLRRTVLDPALSGHGEGLERADHKSALQKVFEVEVWHGGERLSVSTGRSKKEAEQQAASAALVILESRDTPSFS